MPRVFSHFFFSAMLLFDVCDAARKNDEAMQAALRAFGDGANAERVSSSQSSANVTFHTAPSQLAMDVWSWMAGTSPDHSLTCDNGQTYTPAGEADSAGDGQGGITFRYLDGAGGEVLAKVEWPDAGTAIGYSGPLKAANAHIGAESVALHEECQLMKKLGAIPNIVRCEALCSVGQRSVDTPNVMIISPSISAITVSSGTDWKGVLRDVKRQNEEVMSEGGDLGDLYPPVVEQFELGDAKPEEITIDNPEVQAIVEERYSSRLAPTRFQMLGHSGAKLGQSSAELSKVINPSSSSSRTFQAALKGKARNDMDQPWSLEITAVRNIVPNRMTTMMVLEKLALINLQMLEAGVVNQDQFDNVLFSDTAPYILFVDFGMAKDLHSDQCADGACDEEISDQLEYAVFEKFSETDWALDNPLYNTCLAKEVVLNAKRLAGLSGPVAVLFCEKLWTKLTQASGKDVNMPRNWKNGKCR